MSPSIRWLSICVLGVLSFAPEVRSQSTFDTDLAMEFSSFSLGQPVRAQLTIVNRTGSPARLLLGRDRKENLLLSLTGPDGTRSKLPPLPRREGMHDLGRVTLESGDKFEQKLLLNEWATFNDEGTYVLELTLTTAIESKSGSIQVPAFRRTFNVTARDEVKLHQACELYARQIELSRSVREARESASALAAVRDPLAIPYIERALASKKYVEVIMVDALANISDADAIRVLKAVANESSQWPPNTDTTTGYRSMLANQALTHLADSASKGELKDQLQKAIRRAN
jgi:hypothetical protein